METSVDIWDVEALTQCQPVFDVGFRVGDITFEVEFARSIRLLYFVLEDSSKSVSCSGGGGRPSTY